jgi:glucan phosphoethanolaminetransferase (alkaline phosphatase superfamily)
MEKRFKIQLPLWFITVIFAIVIFSVFFTCVCSADALFNNIIVAVFILSLFVVSAIVFYKTFKINVENNEKEKEFERKKEWEKFQYELRKEEREFERKKEWEKFQYELHKEEKTKNEDLVKS